MGSAQPRRTRVDTLPNVERHHHEQAAAAHAESQEAQQPQQAPGTCTCSTRFVAQIIIMCACEYTYMTVHISTFIFLLQIISPLPAQIVNPHQGCQKKEAQNKVCRHIREKLSPKKLLRSLCRSTKKMESCLSGYGPGSGEAPRRELQVTKSVTGRLDGEGKCMGNTHPHRLAVAAGGRGAGNPRGRGCCGTGRGQRWGGAGTWKRVGFGVRGW